MGNDFSACTTCCQILLKLAAAAVATADLTVIIVRALCNLKRRTSDDCMAGMTRGSRPRGPQSEWMAEVTATCVILRFKGALPRSELSSLGKLASLLRGIRPKGLPAIECCTLKRCAPLVLKYNVTFMNGFAYVVPLLHELRRCTNPKEVP